MLVGWAALPKQVFQQFLFTGGDEIKEGRHDGKEEGQGQEGGRGEGQGAADQEAAEIEWVSDVKEGAGQDQGGGEVQEEGITQSDGQEQTKEDQLAQIPLRVLAVWLVHLPLSY